MVFAMKNRDPSSLHVVYNGEARMSLHTKFKSENYLLISRKRGKCWTETSLEQQGHPRSMRSTPSATTSQPAQLG